MKTHPGIMTNNTVNGNFNLSIYRKGKREGIFIIHLVGAINTKFEARTNKYHTIEPEPGYISRFRGKLTKQSEPV